MTKHHNERGQAIAEMTAGLLGLCFVMIGVLVVSFLGLSSIRSTMEARARADQNSIEGTSTGFFDAIETWDDPDKMFLSNDEQMSKDYFQYAVYESMINQLAIGDYELGKYTGKYSNYPLTSLTCSDFLLSAANLTAGTHTESNILSKYNLASAGSMLSSGTSVADATSLVFKNAADLSVSARIVMPVNNLSESNE